MRMIATLRRRLGGEDGFTMAIVMGVLVFASILGVAAFSASRGELPQSGETRARKQAYAAAEAGLNWYQARLTADNDYWTKCTAVPAVATGVPAPVNEAWDGVKVPSAVSASNPDGDPRIWRTLSGSTAQYTIELLPAPGKAKCAEDAMIDSNGGFRIRSTGRFNGIKRSIVARFSRPRFLDFLYFTNYETTDPLAYKTADVDNANAYCGDRYRLARGKDAGGNTVFNCSEIQFAANDKVLGPLHSNDSLLACSTATFGRAPSGGVSYNDNVESSASPGYYNTSGTACSGSLSVQGGAFKSGAPPLDMPDTNDSLEATAGLTLYGSNVITLGAAGSMTIRNLQTGAVTSTTVPPNGLVYVQTDPNTGCAKTVQPRYQEYSGTNAEPAGCADVYVSGTYDTSLTLASAKDVVITANLTRATGSQAMLGLIANNFVRVYHPVSSHSLDGSGLCSGSNLTTTGTSAPYGPSVPNLRIDAAILTLQHSFTVDSYDCGASLGNLTINGAIAQKYRGAVGSQRSNGTQTGYTKDYRYDDALKYRNPPQFMDPVNSAWVMLRSNEQLPAR